MTAAQKWTVVNAFVAKMKEFGCAYDKHKIHTYWIDIVAVFKSTGRSDLSEIVADDVSWINELLAKLPDPLVEEQKPKRGRRSTNRPLTNNGDKLKVAFWFINKIGSADEALKVMEVAVKAQKELSVCA